MIHSYTSIQSLKQVLDFVLELGSNVNKPIYFDTETTGFFDFRSKLVLAQFYFNGKVYIINFINNTKESEKFFSYIMKFIHNKQMLVVGQNLKFDLKFVYWYTGLLLTNVYDTMLAESIITGGNERYSSLKKLSSKYSSIELDKTVRELFTETLVLTDEMLNYGIDDVLVLEDIYSKQIEIIKNLNLNSILDLEMRLLPVVTSMEYTGVKVNLEKWSVLIKELEEKKKVVSKKIIDLVVDKVSEIFDSKFKDVVELAAYFKIPLKRKKDIKHFTDNKDYKTFLSLYFNITSPLQVRTLLNRFSNGLIESTSSKYLKTISEENEFVLKFIELLLEYRTYNIRLNSFGEKFINLVNPVTGRIHASFNQIGTRTGRFSSSNPNLQQIPAEERYRSCFIASEGYKVITADYSQQELRLAGWISGEDKIIEAYKNDIDIHATTASLVFEKVVEEISSKERKVGKGLNFSILYGSTEYGIAYNMNVSVELANKYLHKFMDGYNKLSAFKHAVEKKVLEKMYSSTPMGRKRFFEKRILFSDNREREKYIASIKREGFNHIIQGGSADMLKLALVEMFYKDPFPPGMFNILMVVHDEIVVEVHESIAEEAKDYVVNTMNRVESYFIGDIPPKTGVAVADYWVKD